MQNLRKNVLFMMIPLYKILNSFFLRCYINLDLLVHPLLLQVANVLQLLLAGELTDKQNALIAGRLKDPADSREQLAHGNRVHTRQHNADQFALFGFESLGKEI